jgi:hypothetical protein
LACTVGRKTERLKLKFNMMSIETAIPLFMVTDLFL